MRQTETGELRFEKRGNAFLYANEDVQREAAKRQKQPKR